MNYIWLAGGGFHERFCKGHLTPLESNSSTFLSFPVFHVFSCISMKCFSLYAICLEQH